MAKIDFAECLLRSLECFEKELSELTSCKRCCSAENKPAPHPYSQPRRVHNSKKHGEHSC